MNESDFNDLLKSVEEVDTMIKSNEYMVTVVDGLRVKVKVPPVLKMDPLSEPACKTLRDLANAQMSIIPPLPEPRWKTTLDPKTLKVDREAIEQAPPKISYIVEDEDDFEWILSMMHADEETGGVPMSTKDLRERFEEHFTEDVNIQIISEEDDDDE
ncbi:hypothetical protein KAT92_05320 [Candidatus Babeliales bacterium]|nr:hypothetical protein [Candidatus Babeliales bacterium]